MELIDKAAVAAELERRLEDLYEFLPDASKVENGTITISEACTTGKYTALESFRNYIDTLEVKGVDLENDFGSFWGDYIDSGGDMNNYEVAKHFFELGMSVVNKV